MKKILTMLKTFAFSNALSSIVAVIVGLIFGFIVLLYTNPLEALDGFRTIVFGGFTGGIQGIGDVLYTATPLILTGLSVGLAFRTGLFNIGASGQLIVGGYVAILFGIAVTGLGTFHWVVALLAAIIAGAIWASVPGILKAFFNVHEVISCIMMNYIGMYLVNMLIVDSVVYDKFKNNTLPISRTAVLPKLGLDNVFVGSSVNSGFVIAIVIVIIVYIILNKTVFGYELTACGFNKDAADYAGINSKKNIILAMMIAGALAGCAGGLIYLAGAGRYILVVDQLASEGFMGIPVALLGLSNAIGVFFAALFIGYITIGGFYMQLYSFVPEVIDIIISVIIYFSAFALIVKNVVNRIAKRNKAKHKDAISNRGDEKNE